MDYDNIDKILVRYYEDKVISPTRFHQNPFHHYHNAYEIMFLLDSENEMFIHDSKFIMKSKQIIIIPPYAIHRIYYNVGSCYNRYILNFEQSYLEPVLDAINGIYIMDGISKRQAVAIEPNPKEFIKICSFFTELLRLYNKYKQSSADTGEMRLRLLLADYIIYLHNLLQSHDINEESVSTNDLVKKIVAYINNNYMNNISLEMIQKEFYLSSSYICHKFKELTGLTFIEYLQSTRVAESQRLMSQANYSIIQACYHCGFNSTQHFYRVFKKVTGITPGDYMAKKIKPTVFDA